MAERVSAGLVSRRLGVTTTETPVQRIPCASLLKNGLEVLRLRVKDALVGRLVRTAVRLE
jgi:hypothetical protein